MRTLWMGFDHMTDWNLQSVHNKKQIILNWTLPTLNQSTEHNVTN